MRMIHYIVFCKRPHILIKKKNFFKGLWVFSTPLPIKNRRDGLDNARKT